MNPDPTNMERKIPHEFLDQLQRAAQAIAQPDTDKVELDGSQLLVSVSAANNALTLSWLFTLGHDQGLEGKLWCNLFPKMTLYGVDQMNVIRAVGRLERMIDAVTTAHQQLTPKIKPYVRYQDQRAGRGTRTAESTDAGSDSETPRSE